jgi:LuxR family transcriptional regulator, quorum-sensing system regulator CinR
MDRFEIGPAAMNLAYKVIGKTTDDLLDILGNLAAELGLNHIAYVRLASNKSLDSSLLTAIATYSKEWQRRYFVKQYFLIDPIVRHASQSASNFDWSDIKRENQAIDDFFLDAFQHGVGRNGFSILVRNRKNTAAIVSFTNDLPKPAWAAFKTANLDKLHHAAALIDAAAVAGAKLPDEVDVSLSLREEQCLMWAARGKTYEEIGEITNLSFHSVRSHLDLARHKLRGANLTHTVAIALASGIIPPLTLRQTI